MTKERKEQLETKVYNYLAESDTKNCKIKSVEIDLAAKQVFITFRMKGDFLRVADVTKGCPITFLPEDYDEARLEVSRLREHSEHICYDCGITDNYLFAFNSKIFVMIKDGYICKSNQ